MFYVILFSQILILYHGTILSAKDLRERHLVDGTGTHFTFAKSSSAVNPNYGSGGGDSSQNQGYYPKEYRGAASYGSSNTDSSGGYGSQTTYSPPITSTSKPPSYSYPPTKYSNSKSNSYDYLTESPEGSYYKQPQSGGYETDKYESAPKDTYGLSGSYTKQPQSSGGYQTEKYSSTNSDYQKTYGKYDKSGGGKYNNNNRNGGYGEKYGNYGKQRKDGWGSSLPFPPAPLPGVPPQVPNPQLPPPYIYQYVRFDALYETQKSRKIKSRCLDIQPFRVAGTFCSNATIFDYWFYQGGWCWEGDDAHHCAVTENKFTNAANCFDDCMPRCEMFQQDSQNCMLKGYKEKFGYTVDESTFKCVQVKYYHGCPGKGNLFGNYRDCQRECTEQYKI